MRNHTTSATLYIWAICCPFQLRDLEPRVGLSPCVEKVARKGPSRFFMFSACCRKLWFPYSSIGQRNCKHKSLCNLPLQRNRSSTHLPLVGPVVLYHSPSSASNSPCLWKNKKKNSFLPLELLELVVDQKTLFGRNGLFLQQNPATPT